MAGSLAPALNEAGQVNDIDLMRKQLGMPDPAINPQLKDALTGGTWWDRTKAYLGDTDWGNVAEALTRAGSVFSPPLRQAFNAYDASQGKLAENSQLALGQQARFVTDIPAAIAGIPAMASTVKQLAFGGDALPGAETSASIAGGIDAFGKQMGEAIAGRPYSEDLLRGTPAEMAGNWQRVIGEAIVPLPTKFTAPIINAATTLTRAADAVLTGTNLIQKSTSMAAKTLEAFTPLAVSYSPSLKTMATNAAVQGALAPVAEAAFKSIAPAKEQAQQQQVQADQVAREGIATSTQGYQQAAGVSNAVDAVTKPHVIQAGGLPSTGNAADDLLIAGSLIAAGYTSWKYRNAIWRTVTGYDRGVHADTQTIQPWFTKITQQHSKGDASIYNEIKQTLRADGRYTADQIDDMIARYKEQAASQTGAGITTREDTLYNEGKYMGSSVKSVPMNDMVKTHQLLTPDQKTGFNELAWARQELSDRDRMITTMMHRPTTNPLYTSEPVRNLAGYTRKDLQDIINRHSADPDISNVYRMFRDVVDKAGDYMADQKSMHPTEWASFHGENPFYVPRKSEGQKSFVDPRYPVKTLDPASGVDVPRGVNTFKELGDAMGNVPAYMDEVFRRTEGMKIKRDFFEFAERAIAAGNKHLTQTFPELGGRSVLGRSTKLAPEAAERSVTWRDSNGNKRTTEVNDIVLRDALNGVANPSMLQLQMGKLAILTKYYESGAVGPLSLANLTFFAPKSALYSMTAGTMLPSPKGIAKGYLDRFAQDAFGIRLPGDLSGLAGLPYHAVKNIGEMLVDRGARALHNTVLTDGILTKAFDKATLEATAQKMADWYRKTDSYKMKEQGLAGPSSQNMIDQGKMYKSPEDALKARNLPAATHDFINDILRAIATSPAGVMHAVNKNVEPWRLSSAIRNLSGDPGRSGAFRNAKWLAYGVNVIPWGNVYIQALGKQMEAFTSVDKALYSAQGAATIGAAVAMASQWNASLGEEYTRHQYFERSPDDVSQNVYIGIPGLPASMGLYVPLDPGVRPIKYVAEALTGLHLGAFDGTLFKPENEAERVANAEAIHHKYGTAHEGSVPRSVIQQWLIPPMPGVIQAGLASLGVQARGFGDTRVPTTRSSQGFAGGTMPNEDNLISQFVPGLSNDVMRGIGAGLTDFIFKFYAGMHRDLDPNASAVSNETKSFSEALHTQVLEAAERGKDSTSELGSYPLLSGFHRYVPSQEATSLAVKDKTNNIKDLAERMASVTEQHGPRDMIGNKKIGHQEYAGAHPAQPQDMDTGAFAQDIQALYKRLSPTLQNIKAEYTQYASVANSNLFTPREKRGMQEYFGRTITDYNRRLLIDIQRAEGILSEKYGQKIDFSKKYDFGSSLSKQ